MEASSVPLEAGMAGTIRNTDTQKPKRVSKVSFEDRSSVRYHFNNQLIPFVTTRHVRRLAIDAMLAAKDVTRGILALTAS
ncbi:hypothetical protein M427DRAFT_324300 [Gonapodya prolifera JEL478]|uniref:Uncharacterized protein n=1 Tax=Gonapodya prolifera (strain JEL478) TaxID=1344416 RepID=A0A139AG42_GONPJ|nr:hypothetical protein M427DRAFT_324300 [Gonapodya prolifera JEL478]|eukprot:KXS15383.1 hypothetical protein M427DRAFT_324300 [Gonapodya prolifera JEL478]